MKKNEAQIGGFAVTKKARVILKYATSHNHRQPSTTTHNHPKITQKSHNLLQTVTETEVDFDSGMKQYIYIDR